MSVPEIYANSKDLDDLALKLKPYGITVHKFIDEIILLESDIRDTSIPQHKCRLEAGGTIIDTLENKILCIPPLSHYYIDTVKQKPLRALYAQGLYKVIKARDGSIVNIYSHDGALHLGTNHSIDNTGFTWYGSNMGKLLFNVLPNKFKEATGMRFVDDVLFWNIDDDICMSLGFHNSIMHKGNQPDEAWLIQCIDRSTGKEVSLDACKYLQGNDYLDEEELVDAEDLKLDKLIENADRSKEINRDESNFGYILESKDVSKTEAYSRIFIPSSYFKILMKYCYRSDKKIVSKIRYDKNIISDILENSLSIEDMHMISPEFEKKANTFTHSINMIIEEIIHDYNSSHLKDGFKKDIIRSIKFNEPDLNTDSPLLYKVVRDHVYDIANLDIIMELII